MIELDRKIVARGASVGFGITEPTFPLSHLFDGVDLPKRVVLSLLARHNNQEDLRDVSKRILRYGKQGACPVPGEMERDLPCDPIDLVMVIAGLIWPGLGAWRDVKRGENSHYLLLDFWWGEDGIRPGAVLLVDGIFHFIHLDRDTESIFDSGWMKWQKANWQGPVIHHAIQLLGQDPDNKQSPIIRKIVNRTGHRGGCVLWPSTRGMDLRPFRVDVGGQHAIMRPVGEGFRVGSLPGIPLPLRNEMVRMESFWRWLEGLDIPEDMRATPSPFTFLKPEMKQKRPCGSRGEEQAKRKAPEQTPLFAEEELPQPDENPLLVSVFGEGITAKTDPERIATMLQTAKEGLMRATTAMSPAKIEHWRAVLREVEAGINK